MFRDLINIVVNRLRVTIVILCIVPVLILAGITFGDGKVLGVIGGGISKAEDELKNLQDGDVFLISNKNGLALSTKNYREKKSQSFNIVKADKNDSDQYFTLKKKIDNRGNEFYNIFIQGTSKTIQTAKVEYKSEVDDHDYFLSIGSGSNNQDFVIKDIDESSINIMPVGFIYTYLLLPNKINPSKNYGVFDKTFDESGKVYNYYYRKFFEETTFTDKIIPIKINQKQNIESEQDVSKILPKEGKFRLRNKDGYYITSRPYDEGNKNYLSFYADKSEKNKENQYFKTTSIKNEKDNTVDYNLTSSLSPGNTWYEDSYPSQLIQTSLNVDKVKKYDTNFYNGVYINEVKIIVKSGFLALSKYYKDKVFTENSVIDKDFNDLGRSIDLPFVNWEVVIDTPPPPNISETNICSSSNTTLNQCLILTDQIFSISKENSELGLKASGYKNNNNTPITTAPKDIFDGEQIFKYKAQSFNRGYLYLNGSDNQVLTSINNELKVVKIDGKDGSPNQLFNVSAGTNAGTFSFQDYEGKSIIINPTDKSVKLIKLPKPDPSQNLKLNSIFDTTNKTKCTAADNCIFKDKQLFTLSTKGTNNSLTSIDYTTKKFDPKLIANATLLGAPSNETDPQQQFEWREYGKDRGYIILKGTNTALVTAKDPKSNKQTIMFREFKADQEIQIFNVVRGTDTNTIQIFDKDLQAISLNGTSVITNTLVKNTTTQTFTIGEIVDTTLPCPTTPTPLGCLIPKDSIFALGTKAPDNAIKINGATALSASYNSNDSLHALKWNELSFNKGNLTILGTNNALASVGGKIIVQPYNKTSKGQAFTVLKVPNSDALVFVDFNGLAINMDAKLLTLYPINKSLAIQGLYLKDTITSLLKNNQQFTIRNKDNYAIQILRSDSINLGLINPNEKLPDMKANIRYGNQANKEQRFKWIATGYGKGYIYYDGTSKILKQEGSQLQIVDFKNQKDSEFTVTKGELPDTLMIYDAVGKLLTINPNNSVDSTFNINKGAPTFSTKLSSNTQSLKFSSPVDNYFDIEDPIPVQVKFADTTKRIEGKSDLEFTNSKNVFLRFIDDKDRKEFASKNISDKDVYIITHGFKDTSVFNQGNYKNQFPNHDDKLDNDWVKIAKGLKTYNPNSIVLVLDWSNLSAGQTPGPFSNGDLLRASSFINNVAVAVKSRLNAWGTNNGTKVNVYGHSLGTYMANEIGREFGKINSIVALDPASDWADFNPLSFLKGKNSMPVKWNDNTWSPLRADKYVDDFKQFANYSVSFTGRRSIAGNEGLNKSAHEAFWMSYDDNDLPIADIHTWVNNSFISINTIKKLYNKTSKVVNGKIVITKEETLSYPTYNEISKNLRNYQRVDLLGKKTRYMGFCTINPSIIDCSKGYINGDIVEGSKQVPNDWLLQDWENHHGLVVAKKPITEKNNKDKITDPNIQYGYIMIKETTGNLSIIYPRPFIYDNSKISPNINFELVEFSITNPKYIGYQFDEGYSRYNVFTLVLKRNWFLGWEVDYSKTIQSTVLKDDIDKFKSDLKSNSKPIENKISESPLIFKDKYEVLPTDTFEQKDYKRAWHPPTRSNSTHYNVTKFKDLKKEMKCNDIFKRVGGSDFGLTPDEFYPGFYRDIYNISSKKISFLFLTYKDAFPCTDEGTATIVGLEDIVLITQSQEMVKVPVNPDGTYNWEAVKDKID
jgi:Lipase